MRRAATPEPGLEPGPAEEPAEEPPTEGKWDFS